MKFQIIVGTLLVFLFAFSHSVFAEKKIIGRWIDESPYGGSTIEIYVEDGKTYMSKVYNDGSKGKMEMIKKPSSIYFTVY